MIARFSGWCRAGRDRINAGDTIARGPDGRWGHPGCAASARAGASEYDAIDRAEAMLARAERDRMNQEYQQGIADGLRYQQDKAAYGQELADRFAAEDDFNRFWKYGEDY